MTLTRSRSRDLLAQAENLMPGGVNSPVRAFRAVGGEPVVIESASGCRIKDVDGNEYIDYIGSWGPMLLGHAHEEVIQAVEKAVRAGLSFGATNPCEVELAELIIEMVPSVERVRLVNSGTEATMSAVRLARGYTGRHDIIKFEGCYHGHSDCLLAKAGSGAMTLALPDSAGVPPAVTQNTIILPYNDLAAVEKAFAEKPDQIAGIIIEPVAGNMGVIVPSTEYLQGLRDLCTKHGAVLIFDEVMTGFRVAAGGVQARVGIMPDLTCLGKIVGGGMPLACYGGKKEIMECVAPTGPVYQAGTLSGNPIATAAGRATLEIIKRTPQLYDLIEERSEQLHLGLEKLAEKHGVVACSNRMGSMMTLFFQEGPVVDYNTAKASNTDVYGEFFRGMLTEGIYLAPSQFEAAFIGSAHGEQEIEQTLAAADKAFAKLTRA
ncbi:MAG TPA: glutamate-1-semialdehyde-2,1-aminomutase [Phycisphaerales bacterium]|nr:glutamate-1-semialdehyde-2,1-aminomutase [Phycisphaerales bacterium]